MKTIKQVEIETVFCEDDIPDIPSQYEEGKVYVSKKRDRIGLNCLCGCGDLIQLPVNQPPKSIGNGKMQLEGWRLEVDDKSRITLVGSILQYNCKSHYIITNNKANFV